MNLYDLTAGDISDVVWVWKKNFQIGVYAQSLRFCVFPIQISITFS